MCTRRHRMLFHIIFVLGIGCGIVVWPRNCRYAFTTQIIVYRNPRQCRNVIRVNELCQGLWLWSGWVSNFRWWENWNQNFLFNSRCDFVSCSSRKSIRRCRFRSPLWTCCSYVWHSVRLHAIAYLESSFGVFAWSISDSWKRFSYIRCDATRCTVCWTCIAVKINVVINSLLFDKIIFCYFL